MCKELHTLPRAGGLFDQDPRWLRRMTLVYNLQAEIEEAESKRGSRR